MAGFYSGSGVPDELFKTKILGQLPEFMRVMLVVDRNTFIMMGTFIDEKIRLCLNPPDVFGEFKYGGRIRLTK